MGVRGPKLPFVVALLLAQDVLAERVIGDREVATKELGEWIINGGATSKDLGIVCVEIGVDHVNITIDGSSVGREAIEILAEGLGGHDGVDGSQAHNDLVHQRGIFNAIKRVLSLVGLQTSQCGRGK